MQKNKKIVATVIAVATAVCSVAGFAGCHRHAHQSETHYATCTEAGYYQDSCFKCGKVLSREEFAPALGHDYDGGFCTRCGEADPNDSTLTDEAGKLNLTEDGTLSWNKLKTATKYELSLTLPNETEATVYEIPKTKGSLKLDELFKDENTNRITPFPTGRTFAKFLHYEMYEETVEGEKIEQEFPVEEQADEFRIMKVNGKFEIVRMGYSDENVTLNGFYSAPKTDGDGKPYYLYEVVMEDNDKPQKFNISKQVKLASGNKATYYRSAEDRDKNQKPISSFDMGYQTIPAGASTYYMRVTLANGDHADYDLRVYGLRNMEVTFYFISSNGAGEYSRGAKEPIRCIEGDIIPSSTYLSKNVAKYTILDENFAKIDRVTVTEEWMPGDNLIKYSGGDYTVKSYGSEKATLYVVDDYYKGVADNISAGVAEWSDVYDLKPVWEDNVLKGFALRYLNSSTATEAVIPDYISKDLRLGVVSADFTFAFNLTTLTIGQGEMYYTMPKLNLMSSGITTINLNYINKISGRAFASSGNNLVINCAFSQEHAQSFEQGWNYTSVTGIYEKPFTTNYNVEF